MNVRLIVSRKKQGMIHVYPLLCMDCEGDVFEWVSSFPTYEPRTDGNTSESEYRCVYCGFSVRLYDGDHLVEATDDRDAWCARRHKKPADSDKGKSPLNEGVDNSSALSDRGL